MTEAEQKRIDEAQAKSNESASCVGNCTDSVYDDQVQRRDVLRAGFRAGQRVVSTTKLH